MANQPWQDDGWTAAAAKSHCWQTVLKLRTFSPLCLPLQGPAACPHALLSTTRSYRGPSRQDLRGCWLKVSASAGLFFCFMTLACIKYTHYYNAEFKGCYTLPLKCPFSSSLIILSRAVGNFVWGGNGVENNRSRFFSSANIEGLFCLNLKIKIC